MSVCRNTFINIYKFVTEIKLFLNNKKMTTFIKIYTVVTEIKLFLNDKNWPRCHSSYLEHGSKISIRCFYFLDLDSLIFNTQLPEVAGRLWRREKRRAHDDAHYPRRRLRVFASNASRWSNVRANRCNGDSKLQTLITIQSSRAAEMTVCSFFLHGRCRYGDKCWNEHPRGAGGGGGGGFKNSSSGRSAGQQQPRQGEVEAGGGGRSNAEKGSNCVRRERLLRTEVAHQRPAKPQTSFFCFALICTLYNVLQTLCQVKVI